MKKKKAVKKANPAALKISCLKMAVKTSGPAPESSRPVLAGISRSVVNLLDWTRSYFPFGKKAGV